MTKIIGVWVLAIAACVAIVKLTAIGPTFLVISASRGWGVHVGDMLVLIPLTLAVVVTATVLKARKS